MSLANFNSAADAMNTLTTRMNGFWDGIDADVATRQAAYDALAANLDLVADHRLYFQVTLDPDEVAPTSGYDGVYNDLQAIINDAPIGSHIRVKMAAAKVFETSGYVVMKMHTTLEFFGVDGSAPPGGEPRLKFGAVLFGGNNLLQYIRPDTGCKIIFRSVFVELPAKIDAGQPWIVPHSFTGWFNGIQSAFEFYNSRVFGSDATLSLISNFVGGIVSVSVHNTEIDTVNLVDAAYGIALIAHYSPTLTNGGTLQTGGVLGTTLLMN